MVPNPGSVHSQSVGVGNDVSVMVKGSFILTGEGGTSN